MFQIHDRGSFYGFESGQVEWRTDCMVCRRDNLGDGEVLSLIFVYIEGSLFIDWHIYCRQRIIWNT